MNRAFFNQARLRVFNECIRIAKSGRDVRVSELACRLHRNMALKAKTAHGAQNIVRMHLQTLVAAGFMECIEFSYNDKVYKILKNANGTEFVPPLMKGEKL